jgi:hypothetical protein
LIARNAALNGMNGEKTGGIFALGLMGIVVDAVKFIAGDMSLDGSSKKDPSQSSVSMLIDKWTKSPGEQIYNALDRSTVRGSPSGI